MEPPFDSSGSAPHFYWARPVTLCTDPWPDDDDGPPWGPRPKVVEGKIDD